jgi:hypothetical protein
MDCRAHPLGLGLRGAASSRHEGSALALSPRVPCWMNCYRRCDSNRSRDRNTIKLLNATASINQLMRLRGLRISKVTATANRAMLTADQVRRRRVLLSIFMPVSLDYLCWLTPSIL